MFVWSKQLNQRCEDAQVEIVSKKTINTPIEMFFFLSFFSFFFFLSQLFFMVLCNFSTVITSLLTVDFYPNTYTQSHTHKKIQPIIIFLEKKIPTNSKGQHQEVKQGTV